MSAVSAYYSVFNNSTTITALDKGKYANSRLYTWIANTCPNGYSEGIQSKMCYMTERWRNAVQANTGTMQSRQTKCKLLNPVELFGYSAASYSVTWQYGNSSDHTTDFANPTGAKYGSLYPVWNDSIAALPDRRIFGDLAMTKDVYYNKAIWTNSWLAYNSTVSESYSAEIFTVNTTSGTCDYISTAQGAYVAPVIRLSANPS